MMVRKQHELRRFVVKLEDVGQIGRRLVADIGRYHALVHLDSTTAGENSANFSRLTIVEEYGRAAEAQSLDPFQHAAR